MSFHFAFKLFVLNLEKYQHGEIIYQHLQKRRTKADNCTSIKKTLDLKKYFFLSLILLESSHLASRFLTFKTK